MKKFLAMFLIAFSILGSISVAMADCQPGYCWTWSFPSGCEPC